MANRDPDRRHATRGPNGRWSRAADADPSTAAPVAGGSDTPPAPDGPAPAIPARDARAAREGSSVGAFRLNITAEDVTPAAPGAIPAPPPGMFDVDPAVDVPAARMVAEAINTLVGMAGYPEASAAQVQRVGDHAAPVIRRAATRLGLGDAASSAVPEWVVETGNLSIAVGVAWGPAAALFVRGRLARRREEEAARAEDGQARGGDVRAGQDHRVDPAPAGRPAGAGGRADAGRPDGGNGRGGDGPDGNLGLASLFELPGIRRPGAG